nr:RNA polymerase sigma factor [Burkholderia sp. Ac-20379]
MPRDAAHSSLITTLVKHYDDLVNHVRRRFGDRTFATDVVQDVCLQLLQRPPEDARIHTPLAFLRHLSIHRAIDRWRGDEARAASVDLTGLAAPDLRSDDADGEQCLTYQQTLDELGRRIDALPTRCREVFILHKLHDLSQDEVAAELRISRNMVAKHLARAMAALAPVLPSPSRNAAPNHDAT